MIMVILNEYALDLLVAPFACGPPTMGKMAVFFPPGEALPPADSRVSPSTLGGTP